MNPIGDIKDGNILFPIFYKSLRGSNIDKKGSKSLERRRYCQAIVFINFGAILFFVACSYA